VIASISFRLFIVLILVFLLVQPVSAGGWTVVTLDELPGSLQAEEPFVVGFMVRQHGHHAINVEQASITAYHATSRDTVQALARQEGKTGHYVADLVLPQAGRWTWVVHVAPFPDAAMPDLDVVGQLAAPSTRAASPARWGDAIGGATLLGALPLFYQRQPMSWRNATVVAAAVTIADRVQTQETANTTSPAHKERFADPAATGKALFIAKGCATCHIHEAVEAAFSVQSGPDLTDYMVVPEYVRIWLKDPQAIKPATEMPQLELREGEIEALIAFLSAPSE
jgi:cytochrome c2